MRTVMCILNGQLRPVVVRETVVDVKELQKELDEAIGRSTSRCASPCTKKRPPPGR